MKKLYKLIYSLLFIICIFIIFVISYNKMLDKQLALLYKDDVSKYYGVAEKDKGLELQQKGISNNNFMLYGSSELVTDIPQNPKNFFPIKDEPFIVNVVGRGHSQNLEHTINFGALSKELSGKKIGLVVSIQWFMEKEGIYPDSFVMNFSELQFYRYMKNESISDDSKTYVAKRIYNLTKDKKDYINPFLYSRLYLGKSIVSKVIKNIFKPYFFFREQELIVNDKVKAIELLKSRKPQDIELDKSKQIKWNYEEQIAEEMGKKAVTNNEYYINDDYFNKYISPKMDYFNNVYKDVNLKESLENKDFEELLKLCKQLNIKPLIIIAPVNGRFYDYAGLSREARVNYYNTIETMAKNYGFETLNLKEKDYEPYFMVDIMHLGWKGWLNVDERILEYYKKN